MDSTGPRPPTFMKGYPNLNPQKYMNIGYLKSPYPGKTGQGDYGPRSKRNIGYYSPSDRWHNPWNPVYYTPLDFSDATSKVANIKGSYDQDIPIWLRK